VSLGVFTALERRRLVISLWFLGISYGAWVLKRSDASVEVMMILAGLVVAFTSLAAAAMGINYLRWDNP
jgi:hypothetical protein